MALEFYKLREQPFGATPDPDYLYLSPTHGKALESILYAIQNRRGFMSLVATPGMGKTTLLLEVLKQLQDSVSTAFFFQTMCGPEDLLRGLLDDLGVSSDARSVATLQSDLHRFLRAEAHRGRSVVVVIDEAQNLNQSCLEVVRMLSNFETTRDKLLQIVLAGQPQLREQLASPALLQLRQRIAISARIEPFNTDETRLYIEHRLRVSGCRRDTSLFSREAVDLIADRSEGIPRNINSICFTALTLGARCKQSTIQRDVIREALTELGLSENRVAEPDKASRESEIFPLTRKLVNASPKGFLWRPQLAAVVLLLVLGLWGRTEIQKMSGRDVSSLGPAFTSASATPGSLAEKDGLGNSVLGPVEAQPVTEEVNASVEWGRTEKLATAEKTTAIPRNQKQQIELATDNPAKLWAQVKMSDSDAEVKLARMFLEGTGVDQNCAQAEVLLLDASRKGNTQASSLLSDHACK